MQLSKDLEEALSSIWEFAERKIDNSAEVKARLTKKLGVDLFKQLLEQKFILQSGAKITLTEKGRDLARDIIRRQRLAERLLTDVLEIRGELMDSVACEFEHIISTEVEKSICILLGHPKLCPHGSLIPGGECCRRQEAVLKSIIVSLNRLKQGTSAKIVYMLTHAHPELHKLLAFGVVPGSVIKVHQTFPSFIITIEQTQLALDEQIVKNIYVKRI